MSREFPSAPIPLNQVVFKGNTKQKIIAILQKIAQEEGITLKEVEDIRAIGKVLPDGDLYITIAPSVPTKATHVVRIKAGKWEYKGAQEN